MYERIGRNTYTTHADGGPMYSVHVYIGTDRLTEKTDRGMDRQTM